jgi:L-ascorbate metabolism protein UlaG (beta-lactamase superfamily)
VRVTSTPARHFSGRFINRDRALWTTWSVAGPVHRVFHSGDTGFFDGFADIGRDHGPFDLTLIKVGAYGPTWPDIHLDPEQAVRAHGLLRGKVLLPIHWGTFNLAYHDWFEPPDRVLAATRAAGVAVVIPKLGQQVEPVTPPAPEVWWRLGAAPKKL